jgi:ferredoxin like protein
MKIQNRIDNLVFRTDAESHIKANAEKCRLCPDKPCLNICPAQMFTLSPAGELINSYEGCLECGCCYLICPELIWQYPRGGYGVAFREV